MKFLNIYFFIIKSIIIAWSKMSTEDKITNVRKYMKY